ncbi:MAG: hypothetical protein WD490_09130 [Opitutales bacterium]
MDVTGNGRDDVPADVSGDYRERLGKTSIEKGCLAAGDLSIIISNTDQSSPL